MWTLLSPLLVLALLGLLLLAIGAVGGRYGLSYLKQYNKSSRGISIMSSTFTSFQSSIIAVLLLHISIFQTNEPSPCYSNQTFLLHQSRDKSFTRVFFGQVSWWGLAVCKSNKLNTVKNKLRYAKFFVIFMKN